MSDAVTALARLVHTGNWARDLANARHLHPGLHVDEFDQAWRAVAAAKYETAERNERATGLRP